MKVASGLWFNPWCLRTHIDFVYVYFRSLFYRIDRGSLLPHMLEKSCGVNYGR